MQSSRGLVIFDIDGTLANNQHRVHYLHETPKNWDAFFAAQPYDTPRMDVIRIARMFSAQTSFQIVLLTGRPEQYRTMTRAWLARHEVPYHQLIMRPDKDRTDDHVMKAAHIKSWLEQGVNIVGFFEDRKRICDVARGLGITVFQMAEGDF